MCSEHRTLSLANPAVTNTISIAVLTHLWAFLLHCGKQHKPYTNYVTSPCPSKLSVMSNACLRPHSAPALFLKCNRTRESWPWVSLCILLPSKECTFTALRALLVCVLSNSLFNLPRSRNAHNWECPVSCLTIPLLFFLTVLVHHLPAPLEI